MSREADSVRGQRVGLGAKGPRVRREDARKCPSLLVIVCVSLEVNSLYRYFRVYRQSIIVSAPPTPFLPLATIGSYRRLPEAAGFFAHGTFGSRHSSRGLL